MSVPTYDRLMQPVLRALHELGGSPAITEIDAHVVRQLDLSPEAIAEGHSGRGDMTELEYRLNWARTYLKHAGLIQNVVRGRWALTDLGTATWEIDPKQVVRTVKQQMSRRRENRLAADSADNIARDERRTEPASVNAIDAAEAVLHDAASPLSYQEITKRALEQGLWQTKGATPEATINARLATDIKTNGPNSRFQRVRPGVFALRVWGLPEANPRKAKDSSETPQREAQPASPVNPVQAGPVTSEAEPARRLSFNDAAEAVLERFGKQKPMHYRVITHKILELGLVNTQGETPEATLYAQLLTETKRRAKRGDPPRFVMHGKGLVGLAKWDSGSLAYQIEQHNEQVRRKLHSRLLEMPPADFEALIGQLLVVLGFDDVEVTARSGDGGIDVRGTLVVGDVIRTRMAVQVKRWKRNVQAQIVQQVRGSLGTHEQGLIVTTSDFSTGACSEAERPNAVPVALMKGEQLVKLLVENDIGIRRTGYDLIELDGNEQS